MAIPFAALAIGKGIMDTASGFFGAQATNKAARQSWRNALVDQAFQNRQNQRSFIEQDRSARQRGYDAALQARAAAASARNSAASGGVSGSTVDAMIAETLSIGARNQSRIQDQRDNNKAAYSALGESIKAQTQSRINQTPTASFGLLDMASIGINTGLSIASVNQAKGPRGNI